MDLFLSNFTNRLDAKGRVSIPAPFRGVLNRDGFEGLYVYPSLEAEAVDCGGHALLGEIETLLSPLSTGSETWEVFASTLYGQSEVLKVDGEGRVVLTDSVKVHTGIKADVTFVGMGRKFRMWEPSRFQAYLAEAKDRVREARRQLELHTPASRVSASGARE